MWLIVTLAVVVTIVAIGVIGRVCMTGLRRFIRTLWPHS